MADNIVVRDLMLTEFLTVSTDQTLQEAMCLLLENQEIEHIPNALVAVDSDGCYAGLLTARLLTRSLLALWMPSTAVRENEQRLETEVLEVVRERLHTTVRDALIRGLPVVTPDDRLLTVIELGSDTRLDFIPVIEQTEEGDRPVGLAPVTAIFQAAASLALTPEHEGIRFDQR